MHVFLHMQLYVIEDLNKNYSKIVLRKKYEFGIALD